MVDQLIGSITECFKKLGIDITKVAVAIYRVT